jgi:hypothetical protein
MHEFDEPAPMEVTNTEMREVLGLFDVPAFVRRGQELEYGLGQLRARCERERNALLDMVRLRLRQWSAAAIGPEAWQEAFTAPIDSLWTLAGAEPPDWANKDAHARRLRTIASDLVSSLNRFNRRWTRFVNEIDLEPINYKIDQYNHYYVLEKECSLGSARLAARHFVPRSRLSTETILAEHPTLPVPDLVTKIE